MTRSAGHSPKTGARIVRVPAPARSIPRRCALPWLVFGLGLTVTTGVTATIVGLTDGSEWGFREGRADQLRLNTDSIDFPWRSLAYWVVWSSPAALSLGVAFFLLVTGSRPERLSPPMSAVDRRAVAFAAAGFAAGWAWILSRLGGLSLSGWQSVGDSWSSALEDHYAYRAVAMQSLSLPEAALLVTGLPALFCMPASAVLRSRVKPVGVLGLAAMFAMYSALALLAHQKLLIVMFLVLSAVVAVVFRGARGVLVVLALGAAGFALVNASMSYAMPKWEPVMTVDHLFGRTGDAYPFAVALGSDATGRPVGVLYWTIGVAGGDSQLHLNSVVGEIMYPGSGTMVALAAPVWAFASDGFGGWAIACTLVVAVMVAASIVLANARRSVLAASIGCSLVVSCYWLTQVPVAGILAWSYSALPAVVACTAAWVAARVTIGIGMLTGAPRAGGAVSGA